MNQDECKQLCGELRWKSFWRLREHAIANGARCIIETGTFRGIPADGESTMFLAKLSVELGADFYSVDICEKHIEASHRHLESVPFHGSVYRDDSVVYLSLFASPISILYLDSYDYAEKTPLPAQIHQLAEIGAAYGKLTSNAAVMLDDCNIPGGGKGLLTSKFLEERGWRCVLDGYQKLFLR